MRIIIGLIAAIAIVSGQTSAATIFFYTSTPGAYVTQGTTDTITPSTNPGYSFYGFDNSFDNSITFFVDSPSNYFSFNFAPPTGSALSPGLYLNATRYTSQPLTVPSMSFASNGRGDSSVSGYFNVHEFQSDGFGSILALALDFLYIGDDPNEHVWGSLRFNSNVAVTTTPILNPTPIPLPAGAGLFGVGAALISILRKQRA